MPQTQPIHMLRQDHLEQQAHQLAKDHIVTKSRKSRRSFFLQRLQLQKALRDAYQHFIKIPQKEVADSSAAQWIPDNYLMLQQTLRQIREDMPLGFYRRLPKLGEGALVGYPRVYGIARELIEISQIQFDMNMVKRFVHFYQDIKPLTTGELWALPVMLRLALLESLTEATRRIIRPPKGEGLSVTDLPGPLKDDEIVANCIACLWLLSSQNWHEFFESLSRVEQVLNGDPASVYSNMAFEARDRYRGLVEAIALAAGEQELDVVSKAIELAGEELVRNKEVGEIREPPRLAHVGYYLMDAEGRARLEASLGYHPRWIVHLSRWFRRHALTWYLGGIATLSLLGLLGLVAYALAVGGSLADLIVISVLAAIPMSTIAIVFINWLVTHTVPPQTLPRLDFQERGVPIEYRTMVVIPALLATERDAPFLIRQIEHHFIANSDPNIFFALITDFADAPKKEMTDDEAPLAQTISAIEQLNKKYGHSGYQPFYFFHRGRVWNESEECWMGWERKRGKLEEFNQLLRGGNTTTFTVQVGDLSVLPTIRFVITLDADTILPRETAHQLIGTLAHPLNQAEFDPVSGEIKAGHTILQPRVQVRPASSNRSLFTRVYSGDSVIDLYTRAVSDVFQDLFDEGNYVGKGIYDVDAFQRSLHDKIPENRLLSHDLFEGMQGRCGLVTDVVLYEDYPPHYLVYTDRLHRWVRGDWQLLPWLGRWVPHRTKGRAPNTLSLIDRWKLFDNLRRSLQLPTVLALLISGWLLLPGSSLVWMLFALLPYSIPIVTDFLGTLLHSLFRQQSITTTSPLRLSVLRSLFELIFLPHESLIIFDAISTTLVRLFITHRRMLQWVSAAHTVHLFGKTLHLKSAWQAMIVAPLLAFLFFIMLWFLYPATLLVASPFLLAWVASPYIATRISRPYPKPVAKIIPAQEHKLRLLARSTWLYFEHFVGPEDRWLPPDHFQEDPRGAVAHRTSPTNIGLMLLSTLTAHDLGYIGPLELSVRLRNSFNSMDTLERVRGHFLNWYDTRTLAPLPPRYISTVDSGNLAACLLTLRQGCYEMAQAPVVNWEGLLDTLGMLSFTLVQAHLGQPAEELQAAIISLQDRVKALNDPEQFSPTLLKELFRESQVELEPMLWEAIQNSQEEYTSDIARKLSIWVDRVRHQLRRIRIDIQVLAPWLLAMADIPRPAQLEIRLELAAAWKAFEENLSLHPLLGEISDICKRAINIIEEINDLLEQDEIDVFEWCDVLTYDLRSAGRNSASLLDNYSVLASRAESFFQAMNFNFLLNPHLKVFHLGYHVESQVESQILEAYHYQLLASESQITSLVAIAKGDVPQSHWLHLGRPLTHVDGMRTLLSWTGTMFEYLMPSLLMRRYEGTLLYQSDRASVERQMAYARQIGIPWGISESGYYHFDAVENYQYKPFGVPGLGTKPRGDWDPVIAPYASILALPLYPQAVMQNLVRFENLKMWGLYGLYEAVDFRDHLKTGGPHAIVRSYMVHHQGMILLSLCNYLLDKRMVRRFHADPRIETVELLLQEQTPVGAPIERPPQQEIDSRRNPSERPALDQWRVSPDAPYTQVHTLSNGKYSLLISAAGSGFSRWEGIELTRWRDDPTLSDRGSWIYVEDRLNGQMWSVTRQPTMTTPDRSAVSFYPHRVEFERQDGELVLRTMVMVAPNDDVEIRRVSLINYGSGSRVLALTSYSEIILSQQSADQRHPAYNKMFIESEFLEKEGLLLFRRRPRSAEEKPIYLAHFFTSNHEQVSLTRYETDRAKFLGRGGSAQRPAVFSTPNQTSVLSNTTGATLDPICALQAEIILSPYQTAQIAFITFIAHSRTEAINLAHRYRRWSQIGRAMQDTRLQAEHEFEELELTSQKVEQIQKLLSPLAYFSNALRAEPAVLNANTLGQPGLWPFGISGDYPILLVRMSREQDLGLLDDVVLAHAYWRKRGLMIDLVIFNQRETSYYQDFKSRIHRLLKRTASETWLNKRGGIFILQEDQMNEAEQTLLMTVARVVLDGEVGSLERQLSKLDAAPVRLPRFIPIEQLTPPLDPQAEIQRPTDLLFDNGVGGFTRDGREYVIYLERDQWTPAPWTNVIATSEFGCLVSESAMGTTWSQNSGENRLTPWRNDPVSDPPSEAIYLRDEDTGQIWSPTPLPARADAPYLIRHGTGYSIFEHASHGLEQSVTIFVAPNEPIKIVQLKLRNATKRMRRINVTYYAEWVLGVARENTTPYIAPEFLSNYFALLARNLYNTDFGQHIAFLASTREPTGVTASRTEFLGELGNYIRPAALERVGLTPRVETGIDPCAVLQSLLWLQPGETKEITFLLGQGKDRADAERLISHFQKIENVEAAWLALGKFWDDILGQIQVDTPNKAMDILLNRWLLYQSLAARFWGRTGFYQSSGAFGYRDQLQDAMAYVHTQPELLREHILNAARYQFEEGDVLHWWHPPAGRGLRTRCSDDLLWLPFVTAHYVEATGDREILKEKIPFISAEPLKPDEHERYGQFPTASEATLYEHCCRAIVRGTTAGSHGIPLMGSHDWNDGMNLVGAKGKGESIWLGWFLASTLTNFARICEQMEDSPRAEDYRKQAKKICAAIESAGWDGDWYRRAYYDDGFPLGSKANNDCQIDSIAQSWSILSKGGDPVRAERAMEAVYEQLVDHEDALLLLLKPPFDKTPRNPGYIKGYPPGIRENGGQYTHAALWAIWAYADLGDGERAHRLFELINPIHHSDSPHKAGRYRVEPYVIAADVYSTSPHEGRGGWTWYTGSASWMYRLGVERLLGITRVGDCLEIHPCIPANWKGYQINYRFGKTLYHIRIENPRGESDEVSQLTINGEKTSDLKIPLQDDGKTHEVVVTMK